MKPNAFRHHAPTTVSEVVGLLGTLGDDAKVLAGGQSLIPLMAMRLAAYPDLVDLGRVPELQEVQRIDGHVRVGAMVRQAVAERHATVAEVPLLARALPHIGHFQIRNRGTVGGSIAHADPASELPAVTLALDAVLEVAGPTGSRRLPADGFFTGTWQTQVDDGEILAAIEFPVWGSGSGFAVEELARRSGDFALVGVTVGVQVDGDAITRAAVGMFGVGSTPVRCTQAEAALLAGGAGTDLAEVGRVAATEIDPLDDIHASAAYRRHVTPALVRRALSRALEEARS